MHYPQRLVMLLCILSSLGSIHKSLACYYVSYHFLVVSAWAWHGILYLITPWQYLPRLGMLFYITPWQYLQRLGILFCLYLPRLGILFYILSRLGSIQEDRAV